MTFDQIFLGNGNRGSLLTGLGRSSGVTLSGGGGSPLGGGVFETGPNSRHIEGPSGPGGNTNPDEPPAENRFFTGGLGKVYNDEWQQARITEGAMNLQLGTSMLKLKAEEMAAESTITASAAARGLKMSGSPAAQMIAQKQSAEQALSYTKTQGEFAIKGQLVTEQLIKDRYQYNLQQLRDKQQASEAGMGDWLNTIMKFVGFGASLLDPIAGIAMSLSSALHSGYPRVPPSSQSPENW